MLVLILRASSGPRVNLKLPAVAGLKRHAEDAVIGGLNRTLKKWGGYFRSGNHTHIFQTLQMCGRRAQNAFIVPATPGKSGGSPGR
jgi:hypothetical protein